ncbi:YbaN family protein [Maricaulis parjimensis]|uniref:YbaN family protein n=1 Tax=Maricaulis parjimensis TaxID=144023 RepID=UPI00193A214A|nr:YbaN family protein [Maricaulis parjimensis]
MGLIRVLWLFGGGVFLALAVIGILLPLVPTTPFLLLACFCFARSSKRLHDWLVHHPRFGPLIRDWQLYGAIRPRAKISAILVMVAALLLSVLIGLRLQLILIQLLCMAAAATFILTRPNGPARDKS